MLVLIAHRDPGILELQLNGVPADISGWMRQLGLVLVPQKSVAIYLNGRKHLPKAERNIRVDGEPIRFERSLEYLGMMLDSGLTGTEHVRYAACRALKALGVAVDSILVYAVPIWAGTIGKKTVWRLLDSGQ